MEDYKMVYINQAWCVAFKYFCDLHMIPIPFEIVFFTNIIHYCIYVYCLHKLMTIYVLIFLFFKQYITNKLVIDKNTTRMSRKIGKGYDLVKNQ